MSPEMPGVAAELESLYQEHGRALLLWARRAVGDHQQAEDLVQETFARAWAKADRFDPERGSPRAWLFGIARNLLIDGWRAAGVRPTTVELEPTIDPTSSTDVDRALEAWDVAEGLRRLAPHHREAIVACYYHGHSIAEVAARLGVPEGTVKSRLYYGSRSLRLILEEMGVVR